MKKIIRIASLTLAALLGVFAFGCDKKEETFDPNDIGTPPDYTTAAYDPFEYYAYHSLNNGQYYEDGVWYDTGKNFMDDPQYMDDYLATGMKTMFFQAIQYQQAFIERGVKEDFATSALKKYMDMAQEAGTEKGLIIDWRLYLLSCEDVDSLYKQDDLVDAEWEYVEPSLDDQLAVVKELKLTDGTFQFETKSAFYNFVASCLKEYEDHPIFWGVMLRDEPTYKLFNAAGDLFKAIRAYNPEIQVQQNLLPMYGDGNMFFESWDENLTQAELFAEYLNDWLDKTEADYLMFDSYPIRGNGIETYHLKGMKIAADICKERGKEFYLVMQTTAFKINGNLASRQCQKDDLYWQTNMAMGYGVSKVMYYTYFAKAGGNDSTKGEFSIDGAAFMTHHGEKTELYYMMTDIMAEMNAFAPVIRNFKYNASATIKTLPLDNPVAYDYEKNDSFEKIKSAKVGKGDIALVSELKDSARGNYLYMVQNIVDPVGGKSYDTTIDVDIEFDSQYNYVAIYYKDTVRYQKLKDHKYSTMLSAGYAEFLMPY